jgi:MYXO-CTERM domain-containing protein
MDQARRRITVGTLLLLVIVLTSGLVAASPYALRLLDPRASDWEQLSWIGQTYGAASALLSVLALIGVTVSLFLQAREAKGAREQNLRAIHTELLQMAMDDEVYRRCWGPFFASDDPVGQREHMYVNLIISNWQMQYEMHVFSEPHLRSAAHILFSGEVGQRFWVEVRDLRVNTASTRRERRFHEILEEEYQHALTSPAVAPTPRNPSTQSQPGRSSRRTWQAAFGLAAAGLGAFAALRRRRRRS